MGWVACVSEKSIGKVVCRGRLAKLELILERQ